MLNLAVLLIGFGMGFPLGAAAMSPFSFALERIQCKQQNIFCNSVDVGDQKLILSEHTLRLSFISVYSSNCCAAPFDYSCEIMLGM